MTDKYGLNEYFGIVHSIDTSGAAHPYGGPEAAVGPGNANDHCEVAVHIAHPRTSVCFSLDIRSNSVR